MGPRRSGRERQPTSYEEAPDDESYSDSGVEYQVVRRSSRKRKRDESAPTRTRSGRRVNRPGGWNEESRRRSRRKRDPIDYVDESDSPQFLQSDPSMRDDDDDDDEEEEVAGIEVSDEENDESVPPKRKSARLSQNSADIGEKTPKTSIKMRLSLRNRNTKANNANAQVEEKGSGNVDEEPEIKRSTRIKNRIPLIEEESLEEGQADDGAKDEDFKVPEDAENEEDDDDDFEQGQLEPEPESETHSLQQHRIQTRSAKRRRPGQGHRSSARLADTSRQERRAGIRKSYPKRTIRRRPKRLIVDKQEDRRDARSSYGQRRNSMRPRDFYASESSSSSSSSDDDFLRNAKNVMSPKPPNAPSGESKIPDFLQNPMALNEEMGRPRSSRYGRRRSRNIKSGLDPFGKEAHGRAAKSFSKHPPIEPIKVDLNLTWDDIGGLDHHVRALKEMVFLPLVYPEVFEKFKIEPPKGVLFYGPPGTGKTLCARTLAASCGGEPEQTDSSIKPETHTPLADGKDPNTGETGNNPSSAIDVESKSNGSATLPNGVPETVAPDGFLVPKRDKQGTDASAVEMEIVSNNEVGKPVSDAMKSDVVVEQAAAIMCALKESAKETGGKVSEATAKPKSRRPRVAFFMRNGADCLSKWVGEAERQLRMTFEAAKRHQPSIIFFDEIDGLAPVRSSRQDQIHSSIVSTLLGLMDGLDSRGQIVVIGATNRVDAIDPALRRPGRFDRELIFTLPNGRARRRILEIQTKNWKPAPPSSKVLDAIAERTTGYCGADIRSLCTEAALRAVRRRYPQIYHSSDKLLIDANKVQVSSRDFLSAMTDIVPASHRSARTHARPIPARLNAVLREPFEECTQIIRRIFPQGIPPEVRNDPLKSPGDTFDDISDESEDDEEAELNKSVGNLGREVHGLSRSCLLERPVLRPRLLLSGRPGLGQAQLGPSILHFLEGCPVHAIDLPSLHMNCSARTTEEALVGAVREACRAAPAVLYLPHLHLWWNTAHDSLRSTLIISLRDIPADLPLFFLATTDGDLSTLPIDLTQLFTDTVTLTPSKTEQREEMFASIIEQANTVPKTSTAALRRKRAERMRPLPKAPPPSPKPVSKEENLRQTHEEDRYIRTLRMEMRAFVEQLLRDRKYKVFWEPVDPAEAEDYYEIIKEPMDISKIAAQVDKGMYPTVLAMVRDFDLMVKNAIQYNPAHTEEGAAILRRAHGLVDLVHAWADNLNPLLVENCNRIVAKRIAQATAEKKKQETEMKKQAEEAKLKQQVEEGGSVKNSDEGVTRADPASSPMDFVPAQESVQKEVGISTHGAANGCSERAPRAVPNGYGIPMETEEPVVLATSSDVEVLSHLFKSVTSGVSVDGLERLHVKCATMLYERRRSRDRARVVADMTNMLVESRQDPAIVGNLVE